MNRSYLELASDIVTAMITKGQLRVTQEKTEGWEAFNRKAVHAVGWALQEMYREVMATPQKAHLPQTRDGGKRIIPAH
jgi:hypothetical protein